MTDIILGVLHMCIFPGGLFALAVGLLFKGLDRRVEARLQRRVGPPLIQPLLDIAKLLTKETLIPKTAVRSVFLAAPVVGFAGMAVCAAFIPVPGVFSGLYNMGDLLVLFYLLPIPAIAIMLGGSASSSPFGAMGFSREMLMMLAYETPLLMILLTWILPIVIFMAIGHYMSKKLTDRATGLWYHGWSFEERTHFAGALWGRGNCWVTLFVPEFLQIARPGPAACRCTAPITVRRWRCWP